MAQKEARRLASSDAKARKTDPITSWDAAKNVHATIAQKMIYNCLRLNGPMSDSEIYDSLLRWRVPISPSGARTRRKELVRKRVVRDSGERKSTNSGRRTIVWEVSPVENWIEDE